MRKLLLILLSFGIAFTFQACSDKEGCKDSYADNFDSDADEDDGSCTYTVSFFPEHHGEPIGGDSTYVDSVFIKFNTLSSPGVNASDYDLVVAGDAGEVHVQVSGLKFGNYFVFMTGLDSVERVSGGIPFAFSQSSADIQLVVPVTE